MSGGPSSVLCPSHYQPINFICLDNLCGNNMLCSTCLQEMDTMHNLIKTQQYIATLKELLDCESFESSEASALHKIVSFGSNEQFFVEQIAHFAQEMDKQVKISYASQLQQLFDQFQSQLISRIQHLHKTVLDQVCELPQGLQIQSPIFTSINKFIYKEILKLFTSSSQLDSQSISPILHECYSTRNFCKLFSESVNSTIKTISDNIETLMNNTATIMSAFENKMNQLFNPDTFINQYLQEKHEKVQNEAAIGNQNNNQQCGIFANNQIQNLIENNQKKQLINPIKLQLDFEFNSDEDQLRQQQKCGPQSQQQKQQISSKRLSTNKKKIMQILNFQTNSPDKYLDVWDCQNGQDRQCHSCPRLSNKIIEKESLYSDRIMTSKKMRDFKKLVLSQQQNNIQQTNLKHQSQEQQQPKILQQKSQQTQQQQQKQNPYINLKQLYKKNQVSTSSNKSSNSKMHMLSLNTTNSGAKNSKPKLQQQQPQPNQIQSPMHQLQQVQQQKSLFKPLQKFLNLQIPNISKLNQRKQISSIHDINALLSSPKGIEQQQNCDDNLKINNNGFIQEKIKKSYSQYFIMNQEDAAINLLTPHTANRNSSPVLEEQYLNSPITDLIKINDQSVITSHDDGILVVWIITQLQSPDKKNQTVQMKQSSYIQAHKKQIQFIVQIDLNPSLFLTVGFECNQQQTLRLWQYESESNKKIMIIEEFSNPHDDNQITFIKFLRSEYQNQQQQQQKCVAETSSKTKGSNSITAYFISYSYNESIQIWSININNNSRSSSTEALINLVNNKNKINNKQIEKLNQTKGKIQRMIEIQLENNNNFQLSQQILIHENYAYIASQKEIFVWEFANLFRDFSNEYNVCILQSPSDQSNKRTLQEDNKGPKTNLGQYEDEKIISTSILKKNVLIMTSKFSLLIYSVGFVQKIKEYNLVDKLQKDHQVFQKSSSAQQQTSLSHQLSQFLFINSLNSPDFENLMFICWQYEGNYITYSYNIQTNQFIKQSSSHKTPLSKMFLFRNKYLLTVEGQYFIRIWTILNDDFSSCHKQILEY